MISKVKLAKVDLQDLLGLLEAKSHIFSLNCPRISAQYLFKALGKKIILVGFFGTVKSSSRKWYLPRTAFGS